MLALPLSDPLLGANGGQVLSKFTLHPDYKRVIDAAGAQFEIFYREQILRINSNKEENEEEQKNEEFSQEEIKNFEKKRHKKTEADALKDRLEENLYNILELGHLGMGASENQIKSAYRKLALVYHPDKNPDAKTNPMWLKIQNAYETLLDPEKKKKYDSSLPFDDSIPEETIEESQFFEIFKPVFIRNAFWSSKKPVPDIGDMNTDLKKVEKFYDFWDNFDSWRDFSVFDEYNLDEAENRYERRYMERENKRIKATHLKAERQRIMKLVEQARKCDPRIIKARREAEEQRLKAKLEKQMKKDQYKKEKEDREKKEEEEKLAKQREKEDEERRIIEEKKKAQDEARRIVKDLKTVFAEKVDSPEYDKFWLQTFMEKLKQEDMVKLTDILKNQTSKETALNELLKFIQLFDKTHEIRTKELYKKDKEIAKQRKEEEKKKKEADWSLEELSLLSKGLVKYPVGSKNRWATIASYLGTKSSEEVLAKAKELNNAEAMKAASEKATKEAFAQVQKTGMKTIDAAPDQRIVFDEIGHTTKQQQPQNQNNKEEKKEVEKTKEQPVQKAEAKETKEAAKEEDAWSQEQQKQLETALREFPTTMEAQERWTKIAERVDGKTKKQCIDRFKVLRDAIKKGNPPPKK